MNEPASPHAKIGKFLNRCRPRSYNATTRNTQVNTYSLQNVVTLICLFMFKKKDLRKNINIQWELTSTYIFLWGFLSVFMWLMLNPIIFAFSGADISYKDLNGVWTLMQLWVRLAVEKYYVSRRSVQLVGHWKSLFFLMWIYGNVMDNVVPNSIGY